MRELGTKNLPWNKDTVYALGFYRLIGRTLGIWSLNCNDFGSKIRLFIVFVLQLTMNYNLLREFTSGCISIGNAADFFGFLSGNCLCLLKISVFLIREKEIYYIVASAVKDWSIVGNDESREIMRRYAYVGKLVSIFPLCISLATLAPFILRAPPTIGQIDNHSSVMQNLSTPAMRNLPLGTGCSVVDMSTLLYLAFYFYQFLQLLCICTCYFGCDAIFYGITMHICAQLELLTINIAALGQRYDHGNITEEIVTLIRRHNHLLRLLNLVEDIFHVMIFGLLAGAGSHITLLGIQMLFALQNEIYTTLVYSLIGISILLLQLFAYSFVGDYLTSHAEDVGNAAYNCYWYNFSSRLAKNMMFVIMKSSCAFHLTAGKIFCVNIESFTSIVKTMASFFSVMKLTFVK